MPSSFARRLTDQERSEIIRDVYRKHAAELQSLEDAQQKLTLLLLGVFGAGASFVASAGVHQSLSVPMKCGLSLVTIAITLVGWRYSRRRDRARVAVRRLLVQCEEALGLFDPDVYLTGAALYSPGILSYPQRGRWLSATFAIAAIAALGFLLVVWAPA